MKQSTRAIPLVALVGFLVLIGLGGCLATSEGLSDQESVAADKAALDIGYAGTDSATSVTQDMTLPTTGDSGTTISWTSSDTTVIADTGEVTRPAANAADATVTLTATITKNTESDTKEFTLTVLKDAGLSDTESVAAAKTALVITYAQGDSETSVTQDMTLPTTGASGTTITWTSSDTTVIASDGTVIRPAADATVTLTATIEKNGVSDTKTFTLTVKKDLSDAESVAADKAVLDIDYAGTDSATSVTQDMTLPTTGASGTTISWASDVPGVIANDGTVTRPDVNAANDASVTLTATITKNSESDTKTFALTVKKEQVDITNLDSAEFSLTVTNTNVTALAGGTHTATVGGSLTLTAGTDYDLSITGTGVNSGAVSIANNGTITITNAIILSDGGNYIVKATGKGNYKGEKTVTFTLTVDPKNIADVQSFSISVGDQTLPPLQASTFSVTINNAGLIAGTDYGLSIEKDGAAVNGVTIDNSGLVSIAATIDTVDTGTYTVKAAGKTNYTGETTVDFVLTVVYSIGGLGPAGGIVFYDKGSISDGWRYLEAAPSDLSDYKWGDTVTSVTTGTAIGTGESNTEAIVAAMEAANFTEDYAAKACANYTLGGKDDWFLPSKAELDELYKQRIAIGSFKANYYWSSSQSIPNLAWGKDFDSDDLQLGTTKNSDLHVRAVRAF